MSQSNPHKSMGKGMMVISMVIALGLLTLFFDQEIEQRYNPNQQVNSQRGAGGNVEVVLKRNYAGHYVADGLINGHPTTFMLDTGATNVAIPLHMADELGLEKGRMVNVSTANGMARAYRTRIQTIQLGDITLHDVSALLTPNLGEVLLGMSFLKHLHFSQQGDTLRLSQY